MKLLVIGGGGREHAIIRALKKSPRCSEIWCAPGNGGISYDAHCKAIPATDVDAMVAFAKEEAFDYVVVAQDDPLALGMVDALAAVGIPAFGPDKAAARIEASKVFSKDLMKKYGIPTAKYETFDDPAKVMAYIRAEGKYPVVIKADGLALGIGAAVLVLLYQKIFTTRTLRRLMVIGMFFFADAGWMQYMRTHVYTQGGKPILAAFGHYAQLGFAVCAVVWAVLFFALRSREIPLWKAGRVLAAIAVTLAVVLVVLANIMPGFPSLGKLDDLLVFNDDWGTYRGTAWRISWSAWTAQPFWRKLLGVGPGMMHTAVAQWAGADITARMKTFYAAHNEYLELLLTTGAAGLAAWLWFVIAHLRKAAQNWLRPGVAPVTLALVSYLAHAAVSIRVSMIFPEIMLLFGLVQVFCLPPEGEDAPIQPKGKKARQPVPNGNNAPAPGLIRTWIGPAAAAVVMMVVCGVASRVVFGFLY